MGNKDLDGFLFLPDGRVIVINKELYEEVLSNCIMIDLRHQAGNGEDPQARELTSSEEEVKEAPVYTHNKGENS